MKLPAIALNEEGRFMVRRTGTTKTPKGGSGQDPMNPWGSSTPEAPEPQPETWEEVLRAKVMIDSVSADMMIRAEQAQSRINCQIFMNYVEADIQKGMQFWTDSGRVIECQLPPVDQGGRGYVLAIGGEEKPS